MLLKMQEVPHVGLILGARDIVLLQGLEALGGGGLQPYPKTRRLDKGCYSWLV